LAVEHVGSTAVPGLAAKPIIDIDVVIRSRDELGEVVAALSGAGYEHQGDLDVPGREAFRRGGPDVPRDGTGRVWPPHHLYVCHTDSDELRRHLAFRDFLRTHPDHAKRYAELKRSLAARCADDRETYTEGKSAFVWEVIRLADEEASR